MNPVQFKVSSVEDTPATKVKGMTVFNTEQVNTKKQPMFFGKPLGVQRYDSYKYPIFDRITTQQLGYFWRPEEVSLQKDRGDYQTLRPEQKHIYTSNLKYQIMLDSIQGRGPGMAFIPYCSLPELEACMEVWGFMEMIHSRSYTYIIKNVYSDPSEVRTSGSKTSLWSGSFPCARTAIPTFDILCPLDARFRHPPRRFLRPNSRQSCPCE